MFFFNKTFIIFFVLVKMVKTFNKINFEPNIINSLKMNN